MGLEEFSELFIGQTAGLGEAIHPFADLGVDVAVDDFSLKLVEIDDFLGEERERDANVGGYIQFAAEVKSFKSMVINLALGVLMTLLNIRLAVVMSAVLQVLLPW